MKKVKYLEVEGNTVEEAIGRALQELKLPRKSVRIQVLSEEKKGLFGMPGAEPAKVRVSVISNKENT
ncbi:MAG: Jag N-terminal domain-containing protein [Candidatus Omnitrophota bacterium]|jgi:spoIIIJ-associated protein